MALVLRTVASRLAAAQMAEPDRAGEEIVGKMEASNQLELALSESGCRGASRFDLPLAALIP